VTAVNPMKVSDFHDGHFDGLSIRPNKLVHLFLRTLDDQSFVLILEGVERLALTDVKEGNIIFELVFRTSEAITPSDIEQLYDVRADTSQDLSLLKSAKERGLQVLEVSSSYGAQGLVLFQSWELGQREAQP
jgi:hypothetical protein